MPEINGEVFGMKVPEEMSPRSSIDLGRIVFGEAAARGDPHDLVVREWRIKERLRSLPPPSCKGAGSKSGMGRFARLLRSKRKMQESAEQQPGQEYVDFENDSSITPADSRSDCGPVHYHENFGNNEVYQKGHNLRVDPAIAPDIVNELKMLARVNDQPTCLDFADPNLPPSAKAA